MPSEIQTVYSDLRTKRIVKISDFTSLTCPADIEDAIWAICPLKLIPQDVYRNVQSWEFTIKRRFKEHQVPIDVENVKRFFLLSKRIDCLEQLSKMMNNLRFIRANNMFGSQLLLAEYQKEIEQYKTAGDIGPLLSSLADTREDIPVAVAEFEVKNNSYTEFLISNEVTWNIWSRRIKQSATPQDELDTFRSYLSS